MKTNLRDNLCKLMAKKLPIAATGAITIALATASLSNAAVIDFTGGTVHLLDGSTGVTNGSNLFGNVDYYTEDGFKLDFIGPSGNGFSYNIGDYYGVGNDVIHGHWDTGDYGQLQEIRVSKLDGNLFDLNSFTLTSNTDTGGWVASGNEEAYINSSNGYSELLPVEDWGFSGLNTKVLLDNNFENISWFSFTVNNAVDCFGMDRFFIDEVDPDLETVPEPASILGLLTAGVLGATSLKRKGKENN
jgi:hypothetical protein